MNAYGADARRIMRLSGPNAAEITYYAWDAQRIIAEYNGRGTFHWEKSRFYLGNRLLADFEKRGSGGVTSYFHPDRLGTRLVSNSADKSTLEQTTLPFGMVVPGKMGNPINPVFTTYERSFTTGLDDAMNRGYDSQERFLQTDPLGLAAADLTSPQSLNLYTYVVNDPLNRSDPTGLQDFPWSDLQSAGFKTLGSGGSVATAFLNGFHIGFWIAQNTSGFQDGARGRAHLARVNRGTRYYPGHRTSKRGYSKYRLRIRSYTSWFPECCRAGRRYPEHWTARRGHAGSRCRQQHDFFNRRKFE